MAVKKKDWNELLGGQGSKTGTGEQDKPSQSAEPPVTVLMHTIVGNPSNPRPEEDYTDDDPEFAELKASMQEIGQLQPLAVVSRPVFEKVKPEAVAQASVQARKLLREADWVVVTGNRRLAAARQLGWTRIDIRVQDQLGDEEGRIDEAVIIENIHRKALSKIAEAEYLRVMVDRHGSQEEVARRIGKSQVYVSQRLALLKLAPDIQDEVDAGTLKVKEARQLAGQTTDHEEQRARVAEMRAKAPASQQPRSRPEPRPQNPVLESGSAPPAVPVNPPVQNRVMNGPDRQTVERPDSIPEPRATTVVPDGEATGERRQVKMPWHDGAACADIAIKKMSREQRKRMMEKLLEQELAESEQLAPTS
jgi:ParB family chromosome partitioning protein